jgi:thioredoxin reductase (NADPH)
MGEIETDLNMMSRVPGIFAIGDVRKNSYRQIATAVGEGATAAIAAEHWIAEHAR